MSRVVYVHIGAPKTGTTYLQDRLGRNTSSLAAHGVHFPHGPLNLDPGHAHFKAALDLLGADWGGPPGHAEGHWDTLVRKVRRTSGTVVISHEILAAASPDRIARLMADLEDSEVHVVYSARDLARQLPAVWQEAVKQGRRFSFAKFLRNVQANPDLPFWRAQNLAKVLGRWSAGLPPAQVHLVTVPQPGAPKDLLWERFCAAFGIDPSWAPRESDRANPSMGIAETALIRQLNRRLTRNGLSAHHHRTLVRELLVHQNLAFRKASAKATLPPHLYPWAAEISEGWIEWAEGSGIDIIGDVDDLRPVPPAADEPWVDPDHPAQKDVVAAALDALVAMTEEAANRPDPNEQLTAKMSRAARRFRSS
ncbi:MAG TPA: hypothetical protein VLA97_17695 [Nocardioidaceae bacterium]|nr:hypothetical protein [Nocardioidaceae bacterium]